MTLKTKPATLGKAERQAQAKASALAAQQAQRRRRRVMRAAAAIVAVLAVGGLFALYRSSVGGTPGAGGGGRYAYQVGRLGPGQQAIEFTLPSTTGGQVSLASLRGKTVLLYFHEGLGCQPCWDQIRDLDKSMPALTAAGVEEFLSVTSGPAVLIAQKMRDDGLRSVALADTDLAVSRRYEMNKYGMMGDSRDGHSFLLIGPDGTIRWRADYGGAPNYTMYVPVDQVLADMKAGRTP
ncbi:putative peroxiredoxin [Candidatus Protofrankia californiensis]|uniref:Putative peroxiredoxin n=1 Tax=Candidatus Protofrankia californiensis TaxID=1839754 RepID=A0A1C3PG18_9ACTN|nr:putative peroxiredoxin [Candidatus Protofrankia californiensis]